MITMHPRDNLKGSYFGASFEYMNSYMYRYMLLSKQGLIFWEFWELGGVVTGQNCGGVQFRRCECYGYVAHSFSPRNVH